MKVCKNKGNILSLFEMRWKYLAGFCCLLCSLPALGQAVDSVVTKPSLKTKLILHFDSRRSVVLDRNSKITGIRAGLQFAGRWRSGLGTYFLRPPIRITGVVNAGTEEADTVTAEIKFSYLSVFAEYVWLQNRKWEFSVPLTFGVGSTRLQYVADQGKLTTLKRIPISLVELSVNGHYKFFSWLGLGAGFGYRKTLTGRPIIEQAFDAPFYIIKIKIFLGPVYDAIFKKEKVSEEP